MSYHHISVMPREVLRFLNCRPGKIYVDCTLGGAGHAKTILKHIVPEGVLIGIDQDIDAINNALSVLEPFHGQVRLFHDNFVNLPEILSSLNIDRVDGILIDLGLSCHHIEGSGRGFSFSKDEPLDMRMDTRSSVKAFDLIHTLDEKSLADIFFRFGEERNARKIAHSIVKARKQKPIYSSGELAKIVSGAVVMRKKSHPRRIHPATRVFMALRIAVNKELDRLRSFMGSVPDLLSSGGRLCIISFHSLEDRIVKHSIKELEKECVCPPDFPVCQCNKKRIFLNLTKKVLTPSAEEIAENPMARSAKLRVAEKV